MIIKKNLSGQIYEELKTDILNQKIGFGEKLINRELQKKYGVSSTPVRDAINRLYMDGLLEDISNVGARIITFDIKMALEINEIVALLNKDAVGLSAINSNQNKVIERLTEILVKQREFREDPKYPEYDKQFHNTFFEYCGNKQLMKVHNEYAVLWDMHILIYHRNSEATRESFIEQHQQILNTYANGDYDKAQQLAATHFLNAVSSLEKMLK